MKVIERRQSNRENRIVNNEIDRRENEWKTV